MDSDSEINWDEDEDLGDTEIPGIISIFDILYQFLSNQYKFVPKSTSQSYNHFSSDSSARRRR